MNPFNPIMAAVVLAATSVFAHAGGVVATPTSAPVGGATAPNCLDTINPTSNIINDLGCLLAKTPGASDDAGKRVEEWMRTGDGKGRSFFRDDVKDDQEKLKDMLAAARRWPSASLRQSAGKVADLYYVLGPGGEVPAWIKGHPVVGKKFNHQPAWKAMLEKHLEMDGQIGRIAASGALNGGVETFLMKAAEWAEKVHDKAHPAKKDLPGNIDKNNAASVRADALTRQARLSWAADLNFASMYEEGAFVHKVFGPDDKAKGPDGKPLEGVYAYRDISMKLYSVRNSDGGGLVTMLGIVDITDPDLPSATKFVPLTSPRGEAQTIQLNPGGRPYKLKFDKIGGQIEITLDRTNLKDEKDPKKGSAEDDARKPRSAMKTTLSDLASRRMDQIKKAGVETIDGEEYYVVGQGGPKASFLFYRKSDVAKFQPGDHRLKPEAMAHVLHVDADGETSPLAGKRPMDNAFTKKHCLEYVRRDSEREDYWKVTDKDCGDGKPEATKPPKAAAAKDSTDGKKDERSKGGGLTTGNVKAMNEAVAALTSKFEGAKEVEVGDEINGHVRILKATKDGKDTWIIGFLSSAGVQNDNVAMSFEAGKVKFYADGIFIVEEHANGDKIYRDGKKEMAQYAKDFNNGKRERQPMNGQISKQGIMQYVVDFELFTRLAAKEWDFSSKQIETIKDRLEKHTQVDNDDWTIGGTKKNVIAEVKKQFIQLWPDYKVGGADKSDGSPTPIGGLKGPGTFFNVSAGPNEGCPTKTKINGHDAVRVEHNTAVCLYKGKEDEIKDGVKAEVEAWYLTMAFKKGGSVSGSAFQPVFGAAKDRMPLPAGLKLKGLDPKEDVGNVDPVVRSYFNAPTDGSKGALAAYRHAPGADKMNIKDPKANCLGVIAYWGVSEREAVKGCPEAAF